MSDKELDIGIVIYLSSGLSFKHQDHIIGGIGIHGYVYEDNVEIEPIRGKLNYAQSAYYDLSNQSKEEEEEEITLDEDDTTSPEDKKRKAKLAKPKGKVVRCINAFDYQESFAPIQDKTPYYLNLVALDKLLDLSPFNKVSRITIVEQGGYVAKIFKSLNPNIDENKWTRADGSEIKHKELLINVFNNYLALSKQLTLAIIPIGEDISEYGIDLATLNRNKAINAALFNQPFHGMINPIYQITEEALVAPTKKPAVDKHAFIQLKQVIFKKYVEEENRERFRYHFMSLPTVSAGIKRVDKGGNVKKDRKDYFDYIGKTDTETIYQISDFKTPIKPIDEVSKQLSTYDRTHYNKLFLGIIGEIYKPDNYFDLMNYGGCVFDMVGSYTHRIVMKTSQNKIIGNEISPPRRVQDAIVVMGELEAILDKYYQGELESTGYTITDVTCYFYKKGDRKTTISPDFANGAKRINMTVNYMDNDVIKQMVYGFQVAYDTPPRGLFLHSACMDSKVTLITWCEKGLGVRYAFVIETEDATCIWCNWYSNIILTKRLS
jgi:hypothetical protein